MPETPAGEVNLSTVMDTLAEIQKGLESLNATPTTAPVAPKGIGEGTTSSNTLMSAGDILEMRRQLKKLSTPELYAMFGMQSRRKDVGVPFDTWANTGGIGVQTALSGDVQLQKALDTGGASALIRQDLEPVLYELYIRMFPAFDRFSKEPANGLVHAFNQITSFGDAQFMTELGTVTDDTSVYARQTSNVAVLATRRGISLKSQFAVLAGGAGYNPEQLEMQGGLRAIAHKMQKTIFQGDASDSGGTGANEIGAYDANAFDGLRKILNTARAQNADPTAGTPDDIRTALDRASEQIMEQGGQASIVWCHPHEKVSFDLQQDKNVRYLNTNVEVTPGILTNAVNTVFGPLPLAVAQGDSIGTYVATGTYSGNTVRDMYVLDEAAISLPYLGSEGPTVLDIPIGISGQLTHLFIMFGMWGLAVKAIPFSNKVRIHQ